jgi:hypothetical protein
MRNMKLWLYIFSVQFRIGLEFRAISRDHEALAFAVIAGNQKRKKENAAVSYCLGFITLVHRSYLEMQTSNSY